MRLGGKLFTVFIGLLLSSTGAVIVCSFTPSQSDSHRDTLTLPSPLQLVFPAYFGHHYSIPGDNPETKQGFELGRMLFYEKSLSANNTVSCASCHQQLHAFSDTVAFSRGIDGARQPRNTMALINLLWVRQFFWDGRVTGLENQVDTPMINLHEMGQSFAASIQKLQAKEDYSEKFRAAFGDKKITKDRIEKALAQFERALISGNAKYDQYLQGQYKPTHSELEGIRLFYGGPTKATYARSPSCSHCHGGPKTYEELFMNNGLDSIIQDAGRAAITAMAYDNGRFRVVTLRNIALTAPYMHDGRFKTLAEVLDHYSDHIHNSPTLSPFLKTPNVESDPRHLSFTQQEKEDLLAFLNMLTDSSFVTDPRFSNPFISSTTSYNQKTINSSQHSTQILKNNL